MITKSEASVDGKILLDNCDIYIKKYFQHLIVIMKMIMKKKMHL